MPAACRVHGIALQEINQPASPTIGPTFNKALQREEVVTHFTKAAPARPKACLSSTYQQRRRNIGMRKASHALKIHSSQSQQSGLYLPRRNWQKDQRQRDSAKSESQQCDIRQFASIVFDHKSTPSFEARHICGHASSSNDKLHGILS